MKDQILNKATELFLNQGFKSITMDDIAQQMAISKKTIYSHYGNKEAIVRASTHHVFTAICTGIDHICALQKNPIVELYDVKKYVLEHLKGDRTSPMYQLQKYYPKIHSELLLKRFEYMQDCVIQNVERGLAEGLFRENIDVGFVSRIYFVGITGIKDLEIFPMDHFPSTALHDMFLEYHLRGIVTPKGRKVLNALIHSNQE